MTSVTSNVEDRLANRTVLVTDDNEAVRTAFQVLLSLHGARVLGASSPAEALARAIPGSGPGHPGHELPPRGHLAARKASRCSSELRALHPDVPVILLTAWTHLETAVELVKAGAADYVAKPWDDARLLTTVRNLLELRARVERERAPCARDAPRRARSSPSGTTSAASSTRAMRCTRVASMATQVAHADVPVLITGPNGAGKEVLADIVQANSRVRDAALRQGESPAPCPTS